MKNFILLVLLLSLSSCWNCPPKKGSSVLNTLSVSGQGIIAGRPDMATVIFTVETIDQNASEAQRANARVSQNISTGLRERYALEDRALQTQNYHVGPRFRYHGQQRVNEGFEVRNHLKVQIKDISILGDLLDFLVETGSVQIQSVSFKLSDTHQKSHEAHALAINDAKLRAELMAEKSGRRLGKILTISEPQASAQQIPRPGLAMMASRAESSPSLESGELEVLASVYVTFELL